MTRLVLLGLGGAVSGLLSAAGYWLEIGGLAFSVMPAVWFGGVLAAYLWLVEDVRSPARLGGLLLASLVAWTAALRSLTVLFTLDLVLPSDSGGMAPLNFVLPGGLGAALFAPAFLFLVPRSTLSTPLRIGRAVLGCAAAGGALGWASALIVEAAGRGLENFPMWVPVLVWQPGMGLALGAAAMRPAVPVDLARSSPPALETATPVSDGGRYRPGFGPRGYVAAVLVVIVAYQGWAQYQRYRMVARQTAIDEAITRSIAEAPSSDDLPEIRPMPLEDAVVLQPIAELVPFTPGHRWLAPETPTMFSSRERRVQPRRYEYFVSYAVGEIAQIHVRVTQCPDDAWARYQLRHVGGIHGAIVDPSRFGIVERLGSRVLLAPLAYFWSSGDKIVEVGRTGTPEAVDQVLRVYLDRYPSSIGASFVLP
jgi:hypothetical protein